MYNKSNLLHHGDYTVLAFYLSLIDTDEERLEFEEIYYDYRDYMYNIAFSFVKDDQLAKEVLSKSFEAIALHINEIEKDNPTRLRNFLCKVVKNFSFNYLNSKHAKNTVYSLDDFPDTVVAYDILDTITGDETYKQIVASIYALPEIYKDVLSLYLIDGLDDKAISNLLSRPLATVRSQIQRGKKHLKDILKEVGIYG